LKLQYPTTVDAEAGDVNPETCPSWAHVTIQFPARDRTMPAVAWHWYEGKKNGKNVLPAADLVKGEGEKEKGFSIYFKDGNWHFKNANEKNPKKQVRVVSSGSFLIGEKGILFSFEETTERLLATARGMGWDLKREIDRGMIEMVFIPQPEIVVEGHLLMMRERVAALSARRVVVDSVSVFLHKVKDPQIAREKIFQLASIVQNSGAVGFFATDIPYGSTQISRFGVEETVVDGVLPAARDGDFQRPLAVHAPVAVVAPAGGGARPRNAGAQGENPGFRAPCLPDGRPSRHPPASAPPARAADRESPRTPAGRPPGSSRRSRDRAPWWPAFAAPRSARHRERSSALTRWHAGAPTAR